MIKIFTLLLILANLGFSEEIKNLRVEWHQALWNTKIISKRYPDWPQISNVIIEYDGYNIYYTAPNSYRKQLILRGYTAQNFIENPNLFKTTLFGISPENDCVNLYWEGYSNKQVSQRIKGAMNPRNNYLPNSLKY